MCLNEKIRQYNLKALRVSRTGPSHTRRSSRSKLRLERVSARRRIRRTRTHTIRKSRVIRIFVLKGRKDAIARARRITACTGLRTISAWVIGGVQCRLININGFAFTSVGRLTGLHSLYRLYKSFTAEPS